MRVVVVIAALGVLGSVQVARAQTDNQAAAEVAFREGRALMAKGKTAEACAKFERSQELDPQHGTEYNLGLCYLELGKLASAWTQFNELGAVDTNPRRKADSARRAKQLEPRLVRLLIRVAEPVDGLVIERGGVDVTAIIGLPTRTDPGTYELVAHAPGHTDWKKQVALTAEGTTVTVEIPPLAKVPAAETNPNTGTQPDTGTKPDTGTQPNTGVEPNTGPQPDDSMITGKPAPLPPPKPAPHTSTRQRIGEVVGSAGLLATAAGLAMGGWAWKLDRDAASVCGGDVTECDGDIGQAQDIVNRARDRADLANLFVAIGVAVTATGIVLYLTAPKSEHAVAVKPVVGKQSMGLSLGGQF